MIENPDQYPCLRRYLSIGFRLNPERAAPHFQMVCLESEHQRVFINPFTGYTRFGRTIAT